MERLSKALQQAGVASRRASEEIIFEGRVTVNGEVIVKPEHHVQEKDAILVDGKRLKKKERKLYFLLNKPKGYLCSAERRGNERLVIDLFDNFKERLFSVGRLDKETTGLLIVTNDGEFSNRILHPRYGVEKEYLVKTNEEITPEHLQAISKGAIVEGVRVVPKKVFKVRRNTLKVIIGEGRKREVRVLVESTGMEVMSLARIRIGSLTLGKLPVGFYKELGDKDMELIFKK